MPTPDDLKNAKTALDKAWKEAVKYAQEAHDARRLLDQIPARDTDQMFVEKVKLAEVARDNWLGSARLAQKVIDDYYKSLME